MLNFNQLYYFYVVAQEGSIKAASQKLHLTEPTISTQIKQLENDLGQELFTRKHRKLELNDAGRRTLEHSEKIFSMATFLEESLLAHGAKPPRDQFRVGALQHLSNTFILDFSFRIWEDLHVQMEVHQGSFSELIGKMNSGDLDIILTDESLSNSKRYRSKRLRKDRLLVVANPRLEKLRSNFPYSLNHKPYLSYFPQSRLQQDLDFYFLSVEVKPEHIGCVQDITLMSVATQRLSCFSVLPERVAKPTIKSGQIVALGEVPNHYLEVWGSYPVISDNKALSLQLLKSFR